MIKVTERAAKELTKLLNDNVDMPQARLRIVDRGHGSVGLGIDIESPTDYVVEYQGSSVLIVGEELAEHLNGVTLDIDSDHEGTEFVLLYSRM